MTLPYEEVRSIDMTRQFMRDILTEKRMGQKLLKQRASCCLRHYPWHNQD